MCIISKEVESVSKTNIFVAVDETNTRQLIVYSNNVSNAITNNAMILPVPNPKTIKFHNLTNYKNIFDDCDKMASDVRTLSYSTTKSASTNYGKLDVFNVGSYKVSLALSLDDIRNVDNSVFDLGEGCYHLLSKDYSDPIYGFIICKLDTKKTDYHPFGYSHKIHNNQIFIPTKHYHEHYSFGNYNSPFGSSYADSFGSLLANDNNVDEGWDHKIYLYNTSKFLNSSVTTNYVWNKSNRIDIEKLDFPLGVLNNFEVYKINGNFPNIDLITSPSTIIKPHQMENRRVKESTIKNKVENEESSCIIM